MYEELDKLTAEAEAWLRSTAERMNAEQKSQHAARTFGHVQLVMIMDRNKDGNYELNVYRMNSDFLQNQLSGFAQLFEE